MMEPTGAVKRTGGKAAVAAIASAALLLPAELADAANRLSKKRGKWTAAKAKLNPKEQKKLETLLKRNEGKLRRRFQRNPDQILEAKPEPLVLGRGVQRKKGQRGNWRRDTASASVAVGQCLPWVPTAAFKRTSAPPNSPQAISGSWSSTTICGGWPVLIELYTDMKDPSGRHHKATAVGGNDATLHDSALGPKGHWRMQNKVTYVAAPPAKWSQAPPNCAGVGTPALTCVAPKVFAT